MKAIRLKTDYLFSPLGLGNPTPRFYWNCEGGIRQSAYRVVYARDGETLWDSGRVDSAQMTHIPYMGRPLASRERVIWSATLWDENGCAGETAEGAFEMGLLLPEDWKAQWISGGYKPKRGIRYPADCFRKVFRTDRKITKARLYASARGVYDVRVNGTRIEDFILAPGMTDYRKRIQYQTYDVTKLLAHPDCGQDSGEQTVELRVADGWFRGSTAAYGVTNVFGDTTSVMAQLEITYADGSTQFVCTDATWAWSNDGPIRFADLKDGEIYDARNIPSYGGTARTVPPPRAMLCAADNVPVTEHERFAPRLLRAADGTRILDFGQNIAGYLSFTVKGEPGQKLTLRMGETLDENGRLDLSGIQETRPARGWNRLSLVKKLMGMPIRGKSEVTPKQEITIILSGGTDFYKTSFAVFGFRYAELSGDVPVEPENFTAIAVYSDMEQTGEFSCSDGRVNQLFQNMLWSMKGNFLDIPTDCPTRERLGWTGDAQIFFDTGAYLMDTAAFFRKWLRDCADAQYENGLLPAVVPLQGAELMYRATGVSVGWADAVYLIPWRFYRKYGDRALLDVCWPMMKRYGDYLMGHLGMQDRKQAKANPYNAFTYEKGVHLGEWLEPEEFRDKNYGAKERHPEECTAYLFLAMRTLAEIAGLLGEKAYAAKCREYEDGAKRAYAWLLAETGSLKTSRQAKLVRPLALGLLEGTAREEAGCQLEKAVREYRCRVGTGFLSTPFLLPVLTELGKSGLAYRMLENEEKPGWLGEVKEGATTVWEDWEGKASRNHYSPGSVCQWLFDTVAGIRMDGENHFLITPVPGGSLAHAGASWNSLYGKVESRWEKTKEGMVYRFRIPPNTTAEICLPDGRSVCVEAGEYRFLEG